MSQKGTNRTKKEQSRNTIRYIQTVKKRKKLLKYNTSIISSFSNKLNHFKTDTNR